MQHLSQSLAALPSALASLDGDLGWIDQREL
jgi:hypothetical protein